MRWIFRRRPRTPNAALPEPDVDPGLPIEELRLLREEAPPNFRNSVLDGINRRTLTAHGMDVGWWGIRHMLLEYVQLFLRGLGLDDSKKGN